MAAKLPLRFGFLLFTATVVFGLPEQGVWDVSINKVYARIWSVVFIRFQCMFFKENDRYCVCDVVDFDPSVTA